MSYGYLLTVFILHNLAVVRVKLQDIKSAAGYKLHLYPIMAIPPIAVELARRAPRLLLRPACFLAGRLIWNDYANSWMIPLWLVIVVLAASYPFTSTIGSIYSDWTNERRAAMNNAILCPRVDGGTLALLKELQTSFRAPHTQGLSSILHR